MNRVAHQEMRQRCWQPTARLYRDLIREAVRADPADREMRALLEAIEGQLAAAGSSLH